MKSVLVAVLAASTLTGVGIAAFYSLGSNAKANIDALNDALADGAADHGKASAGEIEAWIERYRAGATGARCREGEKGWAYVCTFRDGSGRRLKFGVMVGASQPLRMSPLVGLRRPLPSASGVE